VGKIQSSIQKAIEKTRRSQLAESQAQREAMPSEAKREEDASRPQTVSEEGLGSGIFQALQSAQIDREVMEESRFVSEVDDRSAIAAYKILRTRVLQRMRSNNWRTLLVTSTGAGEGKTLTASNLALSLSRDVNQSVLLIDLDLQRSKVAKYFGFDIDIKNGIGEYLRGSAEISDIVYRPLGLQRISIIPNRDAIEHSSDFLTGPRMKQLLEWIRQQSDRTIVILDMPPVLVDDDVLAICPDIDAVLLVVAQGKTDRASLEKAMGLLGETNILGVVLNQCDERNGDNAYGYY
jgi:protein-tyrosine kinase